MLAMRSARSVMRSRLLTHLGEIAALREYLRARHESADRGERLVDLVRDRRRHLPERRELAGLHQLVLRRAQPRFGAAMLVDLGLQRGVRFAEIAGALLNLVLSCAAAALRRHIGPVPLHHVKHERMISADDGAADDGSVALVFATEARSVKRWIVQP